MTIYDFQQLIIAVDPAATKWHGTGIGDYTVWHPGSKLTEVMSDDLPDEEDVRIYIDRFTKSDSDTVAPAIKAALESNFIPFEYVTDYEQDTGYIHHSFTCVVG